MSDDHAYFSAALPQPVRQAQAFMERRGQQLSATALRVLAREVILRVSRIEAPQITLSIRPATAEIEALCDALVSHDDQAGAEMVRTARLGGMPADTLYHAYIAEAARRLGQRWDRDEATAAEVILGAGRVYSILRELRTVFLAEHLVAPLGAEAVFASVPGEVHGIGATIAADTLRRKGWDITLVLGLGAGRRAADHRGPGRGAYRRCRRGRAQHRRRAGADGKPSCRPEPVAVQPRVKRRALALHRLKLVDEAGDHAQALVPEFRIAGVKPEGGKKLFVVHRTAGLEHGEILFLKVG